MSIYDILAAKVHAQQAITATPVPMSGGNMSKPREAIDIPEGPNITQQVQQLRVPTLPAPISTRLRPQPPRQIISVPKPVQNIRTQRTPIAGTNNVRVDVRFDRDPADTSFQQANVYLKQGAGNHNFVTTTAGTTASFITSRSSASSVVTVQTASNTGSNHIQHSPSRAVNLL